MCEVTRSNFHYLYPKIEASIKDSSFIAIDTEFTALSLSNFDKSLFDSVKDRYEKQRRILMQTAVCQLGLSAFVWIPDSQRYEAHTYNFYLRPKSFGPLDVRFIFQASSLEFLCQHRFDFNKFAYDGISHLNDEQESLIKECFENKFDICAKESEFEDQLNEHCSIVLVWVVKASEGDTLLLPVSICGDEVSQCLIQVEIRQRFFDVWTNVDSNGQIVVEKVSRKERERLEDISENLSQKIINNLTGFTKVFRLLVKQKKPLIGHNMWTDLMLLYDKFYRTLPKSYEEYRINIVKLFPVIFDTKHISTSMRKIYKESKLFESTTLIKLHESLSSQRGNFFVLYSPHIKHAADFSKYDNSADYHEAGYDAYVCGYLFIKMAHIYYHRNVEAERQTWTNVNDLIEVMTPFKNVINMIWCSVSYVNLEGSDVKSHRPEWLVVSCKDSLHLSSNKLSRLLSGYGAIDIQMLNSKSALIAVPNLYCVRQILKDFARSPLISISRYNIYQHNLFIRSALWCGLLFSASLCIWAIIPCKKS